jgi:hypothetical protein
LGVCPLCAGTECCNEYRDFLDVRCDRCGDFIMTRMAADELGEDSRVRRELRSQTKWITDKGGRAFIGSETVQTARRRSDHLTP